MEVSGLEVQQCKIQIEQGAYAYAGDHGADTYLTAHEPAGDNGDNFHGNSADADRAFGLSGQNHHQGVTGAGAERAFHIHPCADGQQLHAAQQHQNTTP